MRTTINHKTPAAKPALKEVAPVRLKPPPELAVGKVFKVPAQLGACADYLYTVPKLRAQVQKWADELEAREKAVREHLISSVEKSSAGAVGKQARATIRPVDVPVVEDWDKYYKYVLKTKDFSLLQKRPATAAIEERWAAGKTVPGAGKFRVVKVSVEKL